MAHTGSPPAGWYTDPTGLHRARFWDGIAWTEQVRDDVVGPDPSPAAGTRPDPPAAVAGVAEAVAALAHVGVSAAQVGAGHQGGDPAPGLPGPGWYPDPAGRFQARYWDGAWWTHRVASRGVEAVDPLPGATAGLATDAAGGSTDPWSGHPLDGTDDDRAAGFGPEAVSAGQASLALLPRSEECDEPAPVLPRPSAKVRVGGGMILGGALALLVGSTMPWLEVRGPRVDDAWSATGTQIGDGRITIVLGVALAVLGASIVLGRIARVGGPKVGAMGALVAGVAALAVATVDLADVAERAPRLGVPPGAVTDVGAGLWLAFLGALFAVGGGLMAFANRR